MLSTGLMIVKSSHQVPGYVLALAHLGGYLVNEFSGWSDTEKGYIRSAPKLAKQMMSNLYGALHVRVGGSNVTVRGATITGVNWADGYKI